MKVFLLFILFFLSGVLGCVQYAEGETGVPPEIRRVLFVCLLVSFGANLGTQGVERGEKTA